MIIPNSWNVLYTVRFDGDAQHLNDDFESKEEAIAYAKDHIDAQPVVSGVEVFFDEFGTAVDEEVPEVIFSYTDEIEEEPEEDIDELEARLKALENEESVDKYEADEFEVHENLSESSVNSEIDQIVNKWDNIDNLHEEVVEEPVKVNPGIFDTEFEDCEEHDTCPIECTPADLLDEFAKVLGISDDVVIMNKEDEIPTVDEAEVVADDSAFSEIPDVAEETADPIKIEFDSDFFSEYADVEEPNPQPEEIKVEEPAEIETAIVSEEPIAVEAPCEGEECDPHLEDEKPAEEIAKCHVCPECGKEICECGNKELVEAKDLATVPGEAAYVLMQHRPEIEAMCEISSKDTADDVRKFIINTINAEAKDTMSKRRIVSEFEQSKENKSQLLNHVFNVILGADHLYVTPGQKWRNESLVEADEDLIDDTEGKEILISALTEDTHPSEAQPEVDRIKVFNRALELAKKENKPVIYGYYGSDKHGGYRYYEIEFVVCDDLKKCTAEVMKRYNPAGSVLVAYPNKSFVDINEAKNCELEDKMLFVEEVEEMSDIELAEKFYKALEEKHNCK